jgi:hypothetical protein
MKNQPISILLLVVLLISLLAPNFQSSAGNINPSEQHLLADIWLDVRRSGDIVYFVYQSPQIIRRYNLANETWMSNITLPGIPVAFYVDNQYMYVSLDRNTFRYNLDGSSPQLLYTTDYNARTMFTCGQFLHVVDDFAIYRVDLTVPQLTGKHYLPNKFTSSLPVCSRDQVFIVSSNPQRITHYSISTTGMLEAGNYVNISDGNARMFLSPDESKLFVTTGMVYLAGADLTWAGSGLPGSFNDLSFVDNQIVVLKGSTLFRYNANYSEQGRLTQSKVYQRTATKGNSVYTFLPSSGQISVVKVGLDSIKPAYPGAVNPVGRKYRPDKIELGGGIVYLQDNGSRNIHRWLISERRYLSSIPLQDVPTSILYHQNQQRLYVAYNSGKISWFDPSSPKVEYGFINLPQGTCGMAPAGEFLLLCLLRNEYYNYDLSHWQLVYKANGILAAASDINLDVIYSTAWNSTERRLYITNFLGIAKEDIGSDGAVLPDTYSFTYTSSNFVRLSPDGTKVLSGSGMVYKGGKELVYLDQLPDVNNMGFIDADWTSSGLFTTARTDSNEPKPLIQKWNDAFTEVKSEKSIGEPLRLFAFDSGILSISMYQDSPIFEIRDNNLDKVWSSIKTVFLPCLFSNYCFDYLETFNTGNGWPNGETDAVKVTVTNGEYQVLAKKAGYMWLFEAPLQCVHQYYTISVDARAAKTGGGYGIAYGIDPDNPVFLLFEVDPRTKSYAIWYYYYGSWYLRANETDVTAIKTGTSTNKLEIRKHKNPAYIQFYVNGTPVAISYEYYQYPYGDPRYGVFVYANDAGADFRFDNFAYNRDYQEAWNYTFTPQGPEAPLQESMSSNSSRLGELIFFTGE